MLRKSISLILITTLLAACSPSTHNVRGKADAALATHGMPKPGHADTLLPTGSLKIGPHYSIAYMDMILVAGLVALVYQVVDPAAPAWEILEVRLPDRRVQYTMRMQYVHNGGASEARQVMMRRASALAREEGMTGFHVASYSESIDSRIFLPRRTAEAEVVMEFSEPIKVMPPSRPALAGM